MLLVLHSEEKNQGEKLKMRREKKTALKSSSKALMKAPGGIYGMIQVLV